MGAVVSSIEELPSVVQLPNALYDGTRTISILFIVLAYVLHPVFLWCYHRMRAYRAWRAIEKRQAVEVTTYSFLAEIRGARGRWDAGRIIRLLIGFFFVASMGLEISLDLYSLDTEAYILTQPPPVYRENSTKNAPWHVLNLTQINPGYSSELWMDLPNMFETEAKSLYYVTHFPTYFRGKVEKNITGEIVVASWSTDKDTMPDLSYGVNMGSDSSYAEGSANVRVDEVACSSEGPQLKNATIHIDDEGEWGRVIECEEGPQLSSSTDTMRPAIILTANTGTTHVIVEETANFLSFLYSIWETAEGSEILTYSFHIASTVRLAEAIVTGIVQGETEAGACFGLLRAYNRGAEKNKPGNFNDLEKAVPFGENPDSADPVDSLKDVETIEGGVDINILAMSCFILLAVLAIPGCVWSFFLHKSTGIDIYDRDELIRAVSLQGRGSSRDLTAKHSAVRIFVRKEDNGSMSVVVSDAGESKPGRCGQFFRWRNKVVETADPAPVADTVSAYDDGFGGAAVPVGPRTVQLGGVRSGMGRSFPGREGNFRYPTSVSLTPSPVPSSNGSLAGTPIALRSPPLMLRAVSQGVRRNSSFADGRGPSVLFDDVHSLDSSGNSGGYGGGDVPTTNRLFATFGGVTMVAPALSDDDSFVQG